MDVFINREGWLLGEYMPALWLDHWRLVSILRTGWAVWGDGVRRITGGIFGRPPGPEAGGAARAVRLILSLPGEFHTIARVEQGIFAIGGATGAA